MSDNYLNHPRAVDAIQFIGTGESCDRVIDFLGGINPDVCMWKACTYDGGYIQTRDGPKEFSPGDWIIRNANGQFAPCKPDVFEAHYEQAKTSHQS